MQAEVLCGMVYGMRETGPVSSKAGWQGVWEWGWDLTSAVPTATEHNVLLGNVHHAGTPAPTCAEPFYMPHTLHTLSAWDGQAALPPCCLVLWERQNPP